MFQLVLPLILILCDNAELVTVKINEGWLEGTYRPLSTNLGSVYSFQGIPYAEPPVGKLRFKAPLPPKGWKGIRNAKKHGAKCTQFDLLAQKFIPGSEDCLFINVYTPTLTPIKPLPVMFFIHGGGWKSGAGDDDEYGPDFLTPHDVILVTFNYRLEVLGNLCLGIKEVPGNAAMKDQNMALKWVRNNIKYFGGNPDEVTIIGQSAGGVSAIYHMMSPMSEGLFKRAVAMSGVPLNDWTIPFEAKERAFVLGKTLGINTNDPYELLEKLQSIPAKNLTNQFPQVISQENLWQINPFIMFFFVPVVEQDFGQERFLIESPKESLIKGNMQDKDLLIGYTDKETMLLITILESPNSPLSLQKYNLYSELKIPRQILLDIPSKSIIPLADMIQKRYFGNQFISTKTIPGFIQHTTDKFLFNVNRYLRYLPKRCARTYLYRFSAVSKRNRLSPYGEKYGIRGCSHLDDLRYLFDAKSDPNPVNINSREYRLIEQMCTLVTDFVKYGNPTPNCNMMPQWLPYDKYTKNYMRIDDILTPGCNPDGETNEWWRGLYTRSGVSLP